MINDIEMIDSYVMESEMEILMKMGDMCQKQFIMESYYMEEETNGKKDVNIEEVPKVDGVEALKRFWNWLKRCVYAIKTRIYKRLNVKRFKKTINIVEEFINTQLPIESAGHQVIPIEIGKVIDGVTILKQQLLDDEEIDMKISDFLKTYDKISGFNFDPKVNYQHLSELMNSSVIVSPNVQKMKKLYKQISDGYTNENGRSFYSPDNIYANKSYMAVNLHELLSHLKEYEAWTGHLAETNLKIEKLIKDGKQQFDDEIVKSNNFQQYVRYLTLVMKSNLTAIQFVCTMLDCVDKIFNVNEMNKMNVRIKNGKDQ